MEKDPVKRAGDVWLLAMAEAREEQWMDNDPDTGRARYDAAELGDDSSWQSWIGEQQIERGDPLCAAAQHFIAPRSDMVFEPVSRGGWGAAPACALLHAGVVSVGHMCKPARRGAVWMSFDEARERQVAMTNSKAARAQWDATILHLADHECEPVRPERVVHAGEVWRAAECAARETVTAVGANVPELWEALRLHSGSVEDDVERWEERLRQVWRSPAAPSHTGDWHTGAADRAQQANGCCLFVDCDQVVRRHGGEASWMHPYRTDGRFVDETGYLEGWEQETRHVLDRWSTDAQGYVVECDTGRRLVKGELGQLPPAVQMAARARLACSEAAVVDADEWVRGKGGRMQPLKHDGEVINVNAARSGLERAVVWGCRIDATAVYAVDGARKLTPRGDSEDVVSARAAVRHDGRVVGGELAEDPEHHDNYLAELAAQLDTLSGEKAGGRVVVIMDATSPVEALWRYRRLHDRKRRDRYVAAWLEAFDRFTSRHECVVFLWQPSHVGEPANTWADKLADDMITAGGDPLPVPRVARSYESIRWPAARHGIRAWVAPRVAQAALRRLTASVHHTVMQSCQDMGMGKVSEDEERAARAVRALRMHAGDARHTIGAGGEAPVHCPHGCTAACGTPSRWDWAHVQFGCCHPAIVLARKEWTPLAARTVTMLTSAQRDAPSVDLRYMAEAIANPALVEYDTRSAKQGWRPNGFFERGARRAVTGIFDETGDKKVDRDKEVKKQITACKAAAMQVQLAGVRSVKEIAEEVAGWHAERRLLKRIISGWRSVAEAAPPGRVLALAEARGERLLARARLQ